MEELIQVSIPGACVGIMDGIAEDSGDDGTLQKAWSKVRYIKCGKGGFRYIVGVTRETAAEIAESFLDHGETLIADAEGDQSMYAEGRALVRLGNKIQTTIRRP